MLLCSLLLAIAPIDDPVTLAVDLDAGVLGARLWTRCGPPIPGLPFCLGVDGGESGQLGWAGIGTAEIATPLAGIPGTLFLGGAILGQTFVLGDNGSSQDLFEIAPVDPALLGVQLVAQGFTLNATLAVGLTNGLRLRVGVALERPYAGVPVYFAGDEVVDEHVVGDFNGDGYGDVVSYLYRGTDDESFAVHHGRPDGSLEFVQALGSTQCNFTGGLTAADFNGDGRIDIALGCQWLKEVQFYRGLADGTFEFEQSFVLGSGLGLEPSDLAAGELNGDAFAEVVAAMESTDELVVLFGQPSTGPAEVRIATLNAPTDVEVADLDGDGWVDLVVGSYNAAFGAPGAIGVHRGLGGSSFGPLEFIAVHPDGLASVSSVEIGDLTGDAVPDLCVAFRFELGVTVVPGIGDGTFGAPILLPLTEACQSVALGDVNLDGALDIIAVGSDTSEPHLWLQAGGSAFVPGERIHPLGPEATQPTVHDMNADGIPDLVFGSGAGSFVSVLHGTAPGQFPFPSTSFLGPRPSQQRVADMNADGWPDLVTVTQPSVGAWYGMNVRLRQPNGSYASAEVGTMATTIPALGVGDLNGDGFPDIVHFANQGPTPFDRFVIRLGNGDGTTTPFANLGAAGVFPRFVEMLDANNDGNLDFVWATATGGGPLTVALGVGNGLISSTVAVPKDLSNALRVDVHDVDGDGDQDLILVDFDDAQVFLNEPAGAASLFSMQPSLLATGSSFPIGYDLRDVAAGDLNGDGFADLAIAVDSNLTGIYTGLVIALATGPGVFAPAVHYDAVHHEGWRVVVADVNLDGLLDVVLATSNIVEVFFGVGDGSLGASQAYLRGGSGTLDLVVEDLDLDGAIDLGIVSGLNGWVQKLFNQNGEEL